MYESSRNMSTPELQEIEGEDTFKESKKLQSDHIEIALVSYLIYLESIQHGHRTIVYDY